MDEHDEDDLVQLIVTYGDTPENRKRLARFVKNEINAEREACAKVVLGLPPGEGFGGLNRNDVASRILNRGKAS